MKHVMRWTFVAVLAASASGAWSQVVLTGRLLQDRFDGAGEQMALSAVLSFASLDGPGSQAVGFRTWETHPAGWYRMSGGSGNYTMVFSTPAHFMRPIVMTNVYTHAGDVVDRTLSPRADYAVFHEGAWDDKPASDYYQTFLANGTSLTHVGFRLAHDGVDGGGPGKQNLVVSIHRQGKGTPDTWEQVGPAAPVLDVDSGGPKNYIWSAGWNSGEVALTKNQTYAVHLKAEQPTGKFQAFWRVCRDKPASCYRLGAGPTGWLPRELWMSVGTDGDGLVIPYNKRVHKQFVDLTKFSRKWSQTYVAQSQSMAAVILYAATSGLQPSMNRQRLAVRVRQGGPSGPIVGIEKIAIGNGNYTGDASWGTFGVAYAPGEVPLEPGKTYAIEFQSIENFQTLHGFVNIKGQVSDDRPGFNPYRKHPRDSCENGTAYLNGADAMDYDLDMQVIEYAHAANDWARAVDGPNLLKDGDVELWTKFAIDARTVYENLTDAQSKQRFARVTGNGTTVDGGYVQRVERLSQLETYRLAGQVRASWAVDEKRQCFVGYDLTGQHENPKAETIVWTALPRVHGVWVDHVSEPIRPRKDAISLWVRGRATDKGDWPFKADFAGFSLRRVRTDAPAGQ